MFHSQIRIHQLILVAGIVVWVAVGPATANNNFGRVMALIGDPIQVPLFNAEVSVETFDDNDDASVFGLHTCNFGPFSEFRSSQTDISFLLMSDSSQPARSPPSSADSCVAI
jgi:hypothetical protein